MWRDENYITPKPKLFSDAYDYYVDSLQRAFMFTDILRKRGNTYLEHIQKDQPPVLVFKYDMIMDGRTFERPVNFALVRIIDRRKPEKENVPSGRERRSTPVPDSPERNERPIVVIDPRAGHGPGIGGSKLNSQIGVALNFGHPVYFILFFTEPEPGQTLYDVQQAQVRFLEKVNRLHPDSDKPAVIGNCQAGWAAALIGADRPDIVGPMVFNGSPLSYWGGVEGANPMRYKGGLCGGVWLTSLWCDLGEGKFDGANLVAGFEDLNPANTFWTKQYNLWRKVDTEEKRYLDFEKWWGGFFKMNREEIHFIVDSLFVGNELESGFLSLQKGKTISLKNFQDPIVVFASRGDNITPPQQALNWIVKVYGSVDEIRRNGQVIVYLLHERIGHLGIFVSGSVAEKEHKQIMTSVRMIDYLTPGLYEMIIREDPSKPWLNDHIVDFVERDMGDILDLDDGLEDENAFHPAAAISKFNDMVYKTVLSPFVRFWSNEFTAEWIRQIHPLRVQRYLFSDVNPWLFPVSIVADNIRENRYPVEEDNIFRNAEKQFSDAMIAILDTYRDIRDIGQEYTFKLLYDNSWMLTLLDRPASAVADDPAKQIMADELMEQELWQLAMSKGGFAEGIVRIMIAVMGSNRVWQRNQFGLAGRILQKDDRLKSVEQDDLKLMIKQQAMFFNKNPDLALTTLIHLFPEADDRMKALEIAKEIANSDEIIDDLENEMVEKIRTALDFKAGGV